MVAKYICFNEVHKPFYTFEAEGGNPVCPLCRRPVGHLLEGDGVIDINTGQVLGDLRGVLAEMAEADKGQGKDQDQDHGKNPEALPAEADAGRLPTTDRYHSLVTLIKESAKRMHRLPPEQLWDEYEAMRALGDASFLWRVRFWGLVADAGEQISEVASNTDEDARAAWKMAQIYRHWVEYFDGDADKAIEYMYSLNLSPSHYFVMLEAPKAERTTLIHQAHDLGWSPRVMRAMVRVPAEAREGLWQEYLKKHWTIAELEQVVRERFGERLPKPQVLDLRGDDGAVEVDAGAGAVVLRAKGQETRVLLDERQRTMLGALSSPETDVVEGELVPSEMDADPESVLRGARELVTLATRLLKLLGIGRWVEAVEVLDQIQDIIDNMSLALESGVIERVEGTPEAD